MKREDKNLQSRQKIMENAVQEFAEKGYGLSSINTICETGGISKGILYHYYKDKDDLYVSCVRACFDALTAHLSGYAAPGKGDAQARLEAYFGARLDFFRASPPYQRLFFEAILSPPAHLSGAIAEARAAFDTLNHAVFSALLDSVALRPDVTKGEAVETFRQYQDFVNATTPEGDMALHEDRSRRAVSVLLYGVVAREGERL